MGLGAVVTLLLVAGILRAQDAAVPSKATPSSSIDLSSIGYHELSSIDRLSKGEPNQSLDFLDADHVLLTFNRKKMFQRIPEPPSDHQDRVIHAAVLDLNTGRVLKETDWYLHDRRRYLWSLGNGKVLLRRLNDLYLVDSNLHERLLLNSPKDLLWVSLTPGGRQIITETTIDPSATPGGSQKRRKFEVRFLDTDTLQTVRTIFVRQLVNVTGTSNGYADMVNRGDIWLVRFGPSPTRRRSIIRVRSRTAPDVFFSSENSMIVGRCPGADCDYSTSSFALSGHRLWRQHWPTYRISPEIARSDDSSRVAISTLRLAPSLVGASESDDDATVSRNSQPQDFVQQIQVLESATGTPVLALEPSPAVVTGQNFSLSPDGGRLAVVSRSSLDLYNLPSASPAEEAKYAELKSDVSNEFPLVAAPDADNDTHAPNEEEASKSAETDSSAQPLASSQAAAEENHSSDGQAAAATPAQGSARADAQPTAILKVSSRAVLVDVVVTDRKGVPIRGLHQDDFKVLEDGKSQDLRSFQEFEESSTDKPAANPAEAVAPKPSPNVFSNKTHGPESGAIVLVLFDMLNTPTQEQAYARDQLIKFLSSKPKDLQFALCTMSSGSSHLQLVQGFTSDENVLLAAAKSKKNVPRDARWDVARTGTKQNVDMVQILAQEGQSSGFQNLVRTLQHSEVQQQVMDTNERVGITLDSMTSLARYLSGISGRKNIVWLSGSFPVAIAAATNSGNYQVDNPNYNYRIRQVTNLLAESQIAVYPVDIRGMLTGALDAGTATVVPHAPSMNPKVGGGPGSRILAPTPSVPQNFQAFEQEGAERDTLLQFALATGGTAFLSTNGIREAIATASEQGSNYYTLSYSPANKAYDGKFRKITVQLAQKGYTLHYRRGYYADDVYSAARDAELARRARFVALQHASPISHQFAFSVRIAPLGGKKKIDRGKLGAVSVPSRKKATPPAQLEAEHYLIDYSMDGTEPSFQFKDSNYTNTLLLMVASFDRDGNMLSVLSSLGTRQLQQSEYEKTIAKEFGVQQEVDIPADAASIRIGIQDQMSNHLGTVDIPLPVPPDPTLVQSAKNPMPELEKD